MAAEGEFVLVRQYLEQAIEKPPQPVKFGTIAHDHDLYVMLADIAAQQRDLAAIQQYAPIAQRLAARDNHQLYLAITHRAIAVAHRLAGEYDAAAEALSQALKIFSLLETRWQIGRTFAELAELEKARQNQASAREYFSRALEELQPIGAEPEVLRIKTRLANLSVP